jgi:hypothetical protein
MRRRGGSRQLNPFFIAYPNAFFPEYLASSQKQIRIAEIFFKVQEQNWADFPPRF